MIDAERAKEWTPEKQRECRNRYRENNPDKVRESDFKYKRANREKLRLLQAEYRAANRDAIVEKRRRDYYAHPEKAAEATRKWRAKNPDKGVESVGRWQRAHREKQRVHNFICRQVRLGRIIRPVICSKCQTAGRIEGHHEDYSRPLKIVWLCQKCHSVLRRKYAALKLREEKGK